MATPVPIPIYANVNATPAISNAGTSQAITNATTIIVQQPKDWLTSLLDNPLVWITIMLIVVLLIISKIMGKSKADPSTRPWFGMLFRKAKVQEEVKKRFGVLGTPSKYHLYRGGSPIGKVLKLEYIYKNQIQEIVDKKGIIIKSKPLVDNIEETVAIQFRRYGIIPRIKSWLGFGLQYMMVDPKIITERFDKIIIDPKAYIINDADIWTVSTNKELNFVNDLFLKKDLENMRGFVSDMPRRLSSLRPEQAMTTDKMTHESELKEKERQSRLSQYRGS